jgi:hypothetical protein
MRLENEYSAIDTEEYELKDRILRIAHTKVDGYFVRQVELLVEQRRVLARHYLGVDNDTDKRLMVDMLDEYDNLLKSLLNLK